MRAGNLIKDSDLPVTTPSGQTAPFQGEQCLGTGTAPFVQKPGTGNRDRVGGGIHLAAYTWAVSVLSVPHLWSLSLGATWVGRAQ